METIPYPIICAARHIAGNQDFILRSAGTGPRVAIVNKQSRHRAARPLAVDKLATVERHLFKKYEIRISLLLNATSAANVKQTV